MSDIDTSTALEIFGLDWTTFTLADLKKAYRRVSLLVHPDHGGSDELFNTVNECYKHLLKEQAYKHQCSSHFELKRDFEMDVPPKLSLDTSPISKNGEFNITHFNNVFESNHISDDFSRKGYSDFLRNGEHVAPTLDPERVTSTHFHNTFTKHCPSAEKNAIVVHPACLLAPGSLPMHELGVDEVDDYSTTVGGIGAFDCKQAYSSTSMAREYHTFNIPEIQEKQNPTMLEHQRDKDFSGFWDPDMQVQAAKYSQQQDAAESLRRREKMLIRDKKAIAAHNTCCMKMLGFVPSCDT